MDFTRRGFLLSASTALALPALTRAGTGADGRHLVVVFAQGGWDVSYLFDPKLGLDTVDGPELDEDRFNPDDREYLRSAGDLSFVANDLKRPEVNGFFQRWGDQSAIVNGLWVGSIAHRNCKIRMLTGTRTERSPDVGVVTGYATGSERPIPYMDLSGIGITGPLAAFSGQAGRNNQLKLLLDRQLRVDGPRGSDFDYPVHSLAPEDDATVRAFLQKRDARFAQARGATGRSLSRMNDHVESTERAEALRTQGAAFAEGLTYGRSPDLNTQAIAAVDLLSQRLCHTVMIDSGQPFDTHDDNAAQHGSFNMLFGGLSTLMESLEGAGLAHNTTVAVLSEMTRTPKRNADGGKDHWPTTSALLFGAGVAGGQVFGATSDGLDSLAVDLQSGAPHEAGIVPRYDHFAAGLLELTGVDPAAWLPSTEVYRGFIA
jgi:hypothetical protein